jgi:hypothetical protein
MSRKLVTALLALTLTAAVPLAGASVATARMVSRKSHTPCFLRLRQCGYPSAAHTGVTNCAALPAWSPADLPSSDYYYSGSGNTIVIYKPNVTIQGYNIGNWQFSLDGISGTTFNRDCLATNGDYGQLNAIYADSNGSTIASHTTVENSTVVGAGCTTKGSKKVLCTTPGVNQDLVAAGPDARLANDLLVGGVEPVGLSSGSTLENSYVDANGYEVGAHTEDTYSLPGSSHMTITHNTLLNPSYETANVFIDNGTAPCASTGNVITGNFLAGGGFTIYGCSGASAQNGSTLAFTDNDIAQCDGPRTHDYPGLGGTTCGSTPPSGSTDGSAFGAGADADGYWPEGGYFGVGDYVFCTGGTDWTGNTWDDSGARVACG